MISFFGGALCGNFCTSPFHFDSTVVEEAHVGPQENVTSVFLLPEDIMRKKVLTFLKFREIVRLDSALANHKLKGYFHASLRKTILSGFVDFRHLEWCRARQCAAKTLRVTSHLSNNDHNVGTFGFRELKIGATANVSEGALQRLLMDGNSLTTLDIKSYNNFRLQHITPTETNLPLLEINASDNAHLRENVLIALLKCCPRLQVISTRRCHQFTEQLPLALAAHCPELRKVHLQTSSRMYTVSPALHHTGYCELFRRCTQLQSVECTGDFTVTNMQTLADCCRELTSVKLMGPYTYSTIDDNHPRVDAALTALVQNNTNILELFSFLRLSDTSLLVIALYLHNLRVFTLWNCEASLTGLSAIRTSRTKLQTFEVHLQIFIPTLNGVRDEGYIQLSKITSLVIYSTTLTDAQLVTLAQTNRSMHTIHINPPRPIEGPLLSPNALCEALSYWPNLEKFDVRMPTSPRYQGALRMDNTVIYALAQHCPTVSTVYLSGHANLSNEAISTLSNLPLLHTLAANQCVNLLDSGVSIIAEKCPLLQVIALCANHECWYPRSRPAQPQIG